MNAVDAQTATQMVHQLVPAIGRLGVRVDRLAPGSVRLVLPVADNTNHMGTMYAGALFALAELPGGLLPLSVLDPSKYVPIVARVEIDFVAAARTDVSLEASVAPEELSALAATADAEGKAEMVLDLEAMDAQGKVVLRSHAVYQIRPVRG